jgi:calcineurin-like phosphoesterase family protein
MTKRWFTSDLHIEHTLVSRERGFVLPGVQDYDARTNSFVNAADTGAHAEKVAENWDRVVGKDDTVYVLGDIAMNPRKGAFEWLRARPGRKVLICGNHDEVAGFHSKALTERLKPDWAETFAGGITDFLFLKFGGRRVALSHYPYEGEGSRDIEDRHTEVRLRDTGVPLLHGHTHAKHQAHTSEAGTPMFHVGLDAWGLELVPESTIVEWLDYLP